MHFKNTHFILGWILCSTVLIIAADKRNSSKFTKIGCKVYDNTTVTNHTCLVKAMSRKKTVLSFQGNFLRQMNQVLVDLRLFKKFNVYKPFLIDTREDFCDLFSKRKNSPYAKILASITGPYLQTNNTCPLSGWVIFKDVELDLSTLPVMWPGGDYRANVDITANNDKSPCAKMEFFFEVAEKSIF